MKVGGPVYRIGVGGGAASSIQVSTHLHSQNDLRINYFLIATF